MNYKLDLNPNLDESVVFKYRTLRMFIGLIAFSIPFVCWGAVILSQGKSVVPSSISVTYHLGARDFFVGMLAVVGTFLLAYNGHKSPKINLFGKFYSIERYLSVIAGFCAAGVALFPTSVDLNWVNAETLRLVHFPTLNLEDLASTVNYIHCDRVNDCNLSRISLAPSLHFSFAVILFVVLISFCLFFYARTRKKLRYLSRFTDSDNLAIILKIKVRQRLYLLSGGVMVASGVIAIFLGFVSEYVHLRMMVVEVGCLLGFGLSWTVSGLPWLRGSSDKEKSVTDTIDSDTKIKPVVK